MGQNEKDEMNGFLQKQPYSLTMSRHTLGIHQMRVMVRVIEALQPFMGIEVDYTKPSRDVFIKIKVAELIKNNNITPLRQALDGLMKKIVRIVHYLPQKGTYIEVGTPIIQEYNYEHGSGEVELKIGGKLLPQLTDLARGYTKYSLQVAFQTSSPNVMKMYQYIAHFRDKKQIKCNLDTLRKWLHIENKYALPGHIKKRILEPAMKELKEKADVWFDIAQRVMHPKNKRKMLGWKFNIYTKDQPSYKTSTQIDTKRAKTKTEQTLIDTYRLSEKQAEKVVKKIRTEEERKKADKLLYDIRLAIVNKKINTSVGGYTTAILNEHFPHLKL